MGRTERVALVRRRAPHVEAVYRATAQSTRPVGPHGHKSSVSLTGRHSWLQPARLLAFCVPGRHIGLVLVTGIRRRQAPAGAGRRGDAEG